MEVDCSRSSEAAIGNPSAKDGRSKWRTVIPIAATAPASCGMSGSPPAGNHPVRAATSSIPSDITSGGTDNSTTDAPRTVAGRRPRVTAAGEHAEWNTDRCRERERREAEKRGVPGPLADERRDRTAEMQRLPEIQPRGSRQPGDVLLREREIEPEPMPLGCQHRRVGAERILRAAPAGRGRARRNRRAARGGPHGRRGAERTAKTAVHVPCFGWSGGRHSAATGQVPRRVYRRSRAAAEFGARAAR